MMTTQEKVRENRIRRMAHRQGLRLTKSRVRDPRAIGFNCYGLSDERNVAVFGYERGWLSASLDDLEIYLTQP